MDALAPADTTSNAPRMQRARGAVNIGVQTRDDQLDAQTGGQTVLQRLVQEGCGKARLPRIGNRACDQAVLINTSGGITGGDALDWRVDVGVGAAFTMTTQACEKVYGAKAEDEPATVTTHLTVAEGAALNWLPQETILYDRAKLSRSVTAHLNGSARLLMVEPVVFGRRAMGKDMITGSFTDRWRIHRDGKLVHAEGFAVAGDVGGQLAAPFATGENTAMATIALFAPDADAQIEALQNLFRQKPGAMAAATAWNDKLIARLVAEDSYLMRRTLMPAIALLTNGVGVPKVWAL
ncbi:MAG: urease accessory protein UreD [Pseudomonadota bacterium]